MTDLQKSSNKSQLREVTLVQSTPVFHHPLLNLELGVVFHSDGCCEDGLRLNTKTFEGKINGHDILGKEQGLKS